MEGSGRGRNCTHGVSNVTDLQSAALAARHTLPNIQEKGVEPLKSRPLTVHICQFCYSCKIKCGRGDSNPHGTNPRDFKSRAATITPLPQNKTLKASQLALY